MADSQRVHPTDEKEIPKGSGSPPLAAYIVQLPKDQILKTPGPPTRRNKSYSKPPRRRNPCCACLCWLFGLIFLLIALLVIAGGVLFLVFQPRIPKYYVDQIQIEHFNFGGSDNLGLDSQFDITIRARNPNRKIGIYYKDGSDLAVIYSDIELCGGSIPVFYQGHKNTTVLRVSLAGRDVQFSDDLRSALTSQQNDGRVPLYLKINVPLKIKVGSLKSMKFTVKVRCHLTVSRLSANETAGIESRSCKVKL
eukprot:Gb_08846 [translate_table: standard]